jgi:MFS family permease
MAAVAEPVRPVDEKGTPALRLADAKRFPALYWAVVGVATEAFLVLRSQNAGLPVSFVPIIMVVMNLVYALAAYPAGVVSDRLGRSGVLSLGVAFLIVADLLLGLGASIPRVLLGVAFWGLHMGFTQGLLATLVADTAPTELRGTAFGIFNFVGGIAMLAANIIAGGLWDRYGPAAAFLTGAAFTAVALFGLLLLQGQFSKNSS